MRTYDPLLNIVRGEGCYVWDQDGNKYFDTVSGVAVCNLGHCHPAITKAIQEQAALLIHSSNLVTNPYQEQLADSLVELSGLERIFFCNSGAEALEAAIKLARFFGHRKNITHPKIIVMEKAFHGRTLATLSASGNPKIQKGFEPLVEGFIRAPYNDLEALRQLFKEHSGIVAILSEPVQGEGGLNIPTPDYLSGIRALCDEHDCLMILDEVQSGMGRTGKWFGFQHTSIKPDIITLAKGLANGLPIGACIAGSKAADLFGVGNHGSTFGGNPLTTRAASEVIRVIKDEKLLDNVQQRGKELINQLKTGLADTKEALNIRGLGLWIGIELAKPCAPEIVAAGKKQGLILNLVQERIIRLAPPLTITPQETSYLAKQLTHVISLVF